MASKQSILAEKFCDTPVKIEFFNFHTWGCPRYVLNSRGQTGSMIPMWDLELHLVIYAGHLPCHVGSVALILNLKTLHVSPQYYITFDHEYLTAPFLASEDVPPNWAKLFAQSKSSADVDYDLTVVRIKVQDHPTIPLPD